MEFQYPTINFRERMKSLLYKELGKCAWKKVTSIGYFSVDFAHVANPNSNTINCPNSYVILM